MDVIFMLNSADNSLGRFISPGHWVARGMAEQFTRYVLSHPHVIWSVDDSVTSQYLA